MKKRIGILASTLQGRYPRGVHRVARSITERLATYEEFEFVCLTGRVPNQYEIIYDSCNLSKWLESNPLRIESVLYKRRTLRLFKIGINRIVTLLFPPILLAFIYLPIKLWLKKIIDLWRLDKLVKPEFLPKEEQKISLWEQKKKTIKTWIKTWINTGLSLFCPPILLPLLDWIFIKEEGELRQSSVFLRPEPIALNDLDLVISFEMFEEIWDLPIETYSTKIVGWLYDAIPLRINEGTYWQPDRFASCLSKVMLKADRILCISNSTEQDAKTFNSCLRGKTSVVYLGHDVERFRLKPDRQDLEKVLVKFGIDINIPYLLCVGAIEPRKNIVNILRACILLRRSAPNLNFQLVMVGEEGGQAGFYSLLQQVRECVSVIYTGYANDTAVASLLLGAKAFLYPSLWEGFGIPPLEAMTSGTIVVTSDVSSLPEVCGQHAIYCDPYDAQNIAEAIRYCLEMPAEERESRVKEARTHASQFTWEKATEQVIDILREELLTPKEDSSQIQSSEVSVPNYQPIL